MAAADVSHTPSLEGLSLHSMAPIPMGHAQQQLALHQHSQQGHHARKRPRPRSEEHPPSAAAVAAATAGGGTPGMGGLLHRLEELQVSPGSSRRRRTAARRSGEFSSGVTRSRSFLHESASSNAVQKSKVRSERENVLKPSKLSKIVASGKHKDLELLKHVRITSGATCTAVTSQSADSSPDAAAASAASGGPAWNRLKAKARSNSSSSSLSSLQNLDASAISVGALLDSSPRPLASSSTLSQSLQDFSEELGTISLDDGGASGAKKKKKRGRKGHARLPGRASLDEDSSSGSMANESKSTCAQQARKEYSYGDVSVDDLAGYLEDSIIFPKKMSEMAEMMYT